MKQRVINSVYTKLRFLLPGVFCLVLFISSAMAQTDRDQKPGFGERIFWGGNLGMQFGNLTYVDISPLAGYKITEQVHAGIGATYIYYRYKDIYGSFETSIYGGRVFGRYFPMENLFAHVEYELLNLEVPESVSGTNYSNLVRDYISSVFVGGGYAQPIGDRSALILMVLFNLTEEQYSPYQNPVIRIGFNAGF
jgi:hypothetical protein